MSAKWTKLHMSMVMIRERITGRNSFVSFPFSSSLVVDEMRAFNAKMCYIKNVKTFFSFTVFSRTFMDIIVPFRSDTHPVLIHNGF